MAKINVTLRQRKSTAGDRTILYLDFYPPITVEGRQTRREYLGLFVYDHPRNPFDREHNTRANEEAKMKCIRRQNELNKPEIYSEFEIEHLRKKEIGEGSFTDFLKKVISKKTSSFNSWKSMENHLIKFAGKDLTFADITEKFCKDFKDYLLTAKNLKSKIRNLPVGKNTASLYFTKFKNVLRAAYDAGNIPIYLNRKIGSIGLDETRRNYLTMDELNKLVKTPCTHEMVKRAAIFSALTGLRFSDIEKLSWNEVKVVNGDYSLEFTQRKTKGIETLPISAQAVSMLGTRDQVRPFEGLVYNSYKNEFLKKWVASAGIKKKITFHCFRHTFATLQLNAGTDIYTVSKLLGHRDLKTTQVYAKVINKTKREAVDRITLNF